VPDALIHQLQGEQPAHQAVTFDEPDFAPLIPLQKGTASSIPLFCVPGAGATVTDFLPLVQALPASQPVYGLLPKGIDGISNAETSVEAAAARNLAALRQSGINAQTPVHLLGHSFGGQVAFEMACQLVAQGYQVASLTLIDSEAPLASSAVASTPSLADCLREYAESIGFNLDVALDIDPAIYANHDISQLLSLLHQRLLSVGKLPANSSSQLLQGPWQTFYAARQTQYRPTSRYSGQLNLVQVRDPWMNSEDDEQRRRTDSEQWSGWAEKFEVVAGPAQHFTVLKNPHVSELAQWWLKFVSQ